MQTNRATSEAVESFGGSAAFVCGDATDPAIVDYAFSNASDHGRVSAAIFNAGGNRPPRKFLDIDLAMFESLWREAALAALIFGQAATRSMQAKGGTVIFTGASGSLRGRAGYGAFAAAKAAERALAQSMARELGPLGLHVAHVVIDGGVDGLRLNTAMPNVKAERPLDGLLGLDAIAEAYWQLHRQHRSAWTHELDLRPYSEHF